MHRRRIPWIFLAGPARVVSLPGLPPIRVVEITELARVVMAAIARRDGGLMRFGIAALGPPLHQSLYHLGDPCLYQRSLSPVTWR